MATIFKHKDTIYQCVSLQKKLKRLKLKENDIQILFEGELSQSELEKKYLELTQESKKEDDYDNVKLYYFINRETGYSITSIYPTIEHLGEESKNYERCTKETLEAYWNKAKQLSE